VIVPPDDTFEPITAEMWAALRDAYPNAAHLEVCFRLARDLTTCEALWAGETVDHRRLDQDEVFNARRKQLVQLVAPIDLLGSPGLEPTPKEGTQ
jgi:hypothetical protein